MKKLSVLLLVVFALPFLALPALAADKAAEAKALVDSAVAMAQEKGLDATYAAIRDKNGPFMKGEYYIFVGSTEKPMNVVHPINPKLENKDLGKMKDVKGKFFFMEFMNVAKGPGEGWVEYWWPKPGTKEASPKKTFIKRVPGQNVWFACGFYD